MNSSTLSTPNYSSVFCSDFPGCFRVAPELINNLINSILNSFFSIFYDGSKFIYVIDETRMSFWKFIIAGIIFKTIMLLPLYNWLTKVWKDSFKLKLILVLSLSLMLVGYPMTLIHTYFGVYFTNADFGAFFILGIFLNNFKSLTSNTATFFILLSTLFFENLGIVFVFSLFFLRKDLFSTTINKIRYVFASIILPLSLLGISEVSNKNTSYIGFANVYFYDNLRQFWELVAALTLIITKILLLALISTWVARKNLNRLSEYQFELHVLLSTFVLTYFIGFFNSGLSHEGARQTITGQLLLYLNLILFFKSKIFRS